MKRALNQESNLINGLMLGGFCALGVLLAFVLLAFQWSWASALWLTAALVISGGLFVWLSTELERLRVEEGMG
jgi:hypothetical protein